MKKPIDIVRKKELTNLEEVDLPENFPWRVLDCKLVGNPCELDRDTALRGLRFRVWIPSFFIEIGRLTL